MQGVPQWLPTLPAKNIFAAISSLAIREEVLVCWARWKFSVPLALKISTWTGDQMLRRDFLGLAAAAALAGPSGMAEGMEPAAAAAMRTPVRMGRPMELGLIIQPARGGPEETIKRVHDLGLSNCFLSLDAYIGKFTPELAKQMR